MNKEELNAKIGTLEYRSRAIAEELKTLQAQLAEPAKPVLRHGDYGQFPEGNWWIVLLRKEKLEVFGGLSGAGSSCENHLTYCAKNHKGLNFFADLAAMSEPLEEFDARSDKTTGRLRVKLQSVDKYGACQPFDEHDKKILWIETECGHFSADEFHEISLNLRRMEAKMLLDAGK